MNDSQRVILRNQIRLAFHLREQTQRIKEKKLYGDSGIPDPVLSNCSDFPIGLSLDYEDLLISLHELYNVATDYVVVPATELLLTKDTHKASNPQVPLPDMTSSTTSTTTTDTCTLTQYQIVQETGQKTSKRNKMYLGNLDGQQQETQKQNNKPWKVFKCYW
jgi:hypothetical protein